MLFACLMTLVPLSHAASDAGVRLGMLFNFIKFTEWPASVLGENTAPMRICIGGGDEDLTAGLAALQGRTVQGHPIETVVVDTPDALSACRVLYLPATLSRRVPAYIDAVTGPILTVSDAPDFAERGGMIGLIVEHDHYVFDINNEAIRHTGLRMHPQVLKLARRVR